MPQISQAHAVARVRVLEGRLLRPEQLERLLVAESASAAAKLLEEYGYTLDSAEPSAYEGALQKAQEEACALLRELSPDETLTDAFLLQTDYQNAKLIRKGMLTGAQVQGSLSRCGTFPPDKLLHAITESDFYGLPAEMADALRELNRQLTAKDDPFLIDQVLDSAWIQSVFARCKGNVRAKQYFTTWVDLTNLRSVLRARKAGLDHEQTRAQMLSVGSVPVKELMDNAEDMDRLGRLFQKKPYFAALRAALEDYAQNHDLMVLERTQDDILLGLYREKRQETVAIEPLIGYFLGKTREISMLRLIMVGKINGFKQERLRERLRALYVG